MSDHEINPRTPIAVDLAQWPEARGSRRVYHNDPDRQARVAMALIGFKHEAEMYGPPDPEFTTAIDIVLRGFHKRHPEFLVDGLERDPETEMGRGLYHPDDRLVNYMVQILESGNSEAG